MDGPIHRWQAVTVLPLTDRLWVGETGDCLEISYRDARGSLFFPQTFKFFFRFFSIIPVVQVTRLPAHDDPAVFSQFCQRLTLFLS